MRVEVVYGAPLSGKTTYALDRLGPRDVVYDYDRLLTALTGRRFHTADKHAAHLLVIDLRFWFLDRLRVDADIDGAYIVTRWPSQSLMDALEDLRPTYALMDATREECHARLDADDTRPDKAEWRAVIDAWFDQYEGAEPVARREGGISIMEKTRGPTGRPADARHFWNWITDEGGSRTLYLNGVIASESWFEDDVTPAMFREELMAGDGDIEVWINSPGGDCVAASQIYSMLMDYPHDVTVKIDGLAASAASVVAMAGTTVLMAPTALMMCHNPLTIALGDTEEMRKAIALLDEVKESIINAYEIKTGLSRARISHLMDAETWMNVNKAVELGFADGVLFRADNALPTVPDAQDGMIFSRRAVACSLLDKLRRKLPDKPGTPIASLDKRLALLR